MDDDFHDLFKQSVPEAPSTTGWAAGARRRRRTRQAVGGGVAALAVLGVAVPLALSLSGGTSPIVASPEPAPATSASESALPTESPTSGTVELSPAEGGKLGAAACFDAAGEPVLDVHNQGAIPAGAVRAWLCTNPDNYGTVGPLEPLVTDVDGLVAALYAQPELTDDGAAESAEPYTVVFEYADGRMMSFTGDAQDSTVLTDGDTRLQGSEEFFVGQVRARWLDQRAELSPSGAYQSPLECPAVGYQRSLMPTPFTEVTGGYACVTEDGVAVKSVELRESLAAQIGVEALANAVPVEASTEGGDRVLVLTTQWGDRALLRQAGDRYEFAGDQGLMGWTPAADLAAELDAIFG